jgi:hypothetical protein
VVDALSDEDREDARALGVGWAEEEMRVHDHLFSSTPRGTFPGDVSAALALRGARYGAGHEKGCAYGQAILDAAVAAWTKGRGERAFLIARSIRAEVAVLHEEGATFDDATAGMVADVLTYLAEEYSRARPGEPAVVLFGASTRPFDLRAKRGG